MTSPSPYGEKAGEPKPLPKDPHAPPPPPLLTDLDEAEIRADIREMRADIERHMERLLVDPSRRDEYIERTHREIARLEGMLHG